MPPKYDNNDSISIERKHMESYSEKGRTESLANTDTEIMFARDRSETEVKISKK